MGSELVILAAGVGRRFGGLKQIEPVGPGGAALMDYTVFDALRSGFDRIVLVVRRETEAAIRAHVERGFGRRVPVTFAFQDLQAIPAGFAVPAGRTRPWGTGQAVLAAGPALSGPFAVANADDLYGGPALAALGAFLAQPPTSPPTWAMAGYPLGDTLPSTGAVSRGLVRAEGGWLRSIDEVVAIRRHPDGARWETDDGPRVVPATTPVSMNLWGFRLDVLADLEARFRRFLGSSPGPDDEFYLPVAVGEAVEAGAARVRVLPAGGRWCGMTSAADRAAVRETLAALVAAGAYPDRLWG